MDILDDIDVPSAQDASVVLEPERTNKKLLHHLQKLKNEAAYWQQEIDRAELKKQSETINTYQDSEIIQALLSGNENFIQNQSKSDNKEGENDDDELENYSVKPIRDNNLDYLAKFHCLKLEPCTSSQMVGRDLFLNEFKGVCADNLFHFRVQLYVHPLDQTVRSFNVKTSPWVTEELSDLIERSQESKNILEFMHGLAEYGELYKTRRTVFEKLCRSLGSYDELWRTSSVLTFKPQNGFQLILHWPILTRVEGVVSSPTVDLRASLSHMNADSTHALQKVKTVFGSLVEKSGIYTATCVLHNILHG